MRDKGCRGVNFFNLCKKKTFFKKSVTDLYSSKKKLTLAKQNKLNQINHQTFPNSCFKILRLAIPGDGSSQEKI